MPRVIDSLPSLYQDLLPELFRREMPPEEKATCAACAMCASSAENAVEPVDGVERLFRADTKCCTYQPRLPNFLLGALLSDDDPALAEGRRRVTERIESRVGVSPLWLKPPAKFSLLYANGKQFFGRSASLRCPYYEPEKGACTIWRYRESVCSTFYCRYMAGADGRRFWMAVKAYLALVEFQLARHAVLKLLPEFLHEARDREEVHAGVGPLGPEELDETAPEPKAYASLWKQWEGRELEFYRACYDEVRKLGAEDLQRMLGLDGTIELGVLEQRYRAATGRTLPERLKFNPAATVKWLSDGNVALGAYSEYDALALPGAAYELLVRFTGQETVEEVRSRLRSEKGADLHEDVLLELYRHRVLTDCDNAVPRAAGRGGPRRAIGLTGR